MNKFTENLIKNLQKQTIEEYIFYSLNTWEEYIEKNNISDKYIVDFLLEVKNNEKLKEFIDEEGILDLKFLQNKITNRLVIGSDSFRNIEKGLDINVKDYFDEYRQHLKTVDMDDSFKFKLILYELSEKVKPVPHLIMYDTIANEERTAVYNIRYYNKEISEYLYVELICGKELGLEVLTDTRNKENEEKIKKEIGDIEKLLANGLFNLIVYDDYPKSLETILPEKIYRAQIEDRIFKDQTQVKYQGEIYRAIELKDSYVAVDENLLGEKDPAKAKAIYCKTSLRKSFLF